MTFNVPLHSAEPHKSHTSSFLNTLEPIQNGRHFADDPFKCIFLNENVRISINFSLKFVPWGQINNIPALVQIMAWCPSGDKQLSVPMLASLPTHICVTWPQWAKSAMKLKAVRPVDQGRIQSSLWASDAIWRHRSGSTLSDGTKPLLKTMFTYHQWGYVALTYE